MKKQVEFSFGDDSIAKAYDTVLVPSLFEPWADQLVIDNEPWNSLSVLDLACGTGVVTKELAKNVGPEGKIYALDMNSQMLDLAEAKCKEWSNIEFIEGSADSLAMPDSSLDKVVCQQGFQFFPNKKAAAREIYRVLKPGSKAILSTWCSVTACEIFGVICSTLESLHLDELSQMMRVPFDLLTQQELQESFTGMGFTKVKCFTQEQRLFIKGGLNEAIGFVYATPIGPRLVALKIEEQKNFQKLFMDKLTGLIHEDGSIGRMVSNVIHLEK